MDLVPNIAFGDLGHSSLAEVVAAGFRAYATGTIAIEQGKGESRVFMRYGSPCGVQLYLQHKPFSFSLVESGLIEPGAMEKFLAASLKSGQRLGEVLVQAGVLTEEQVLELVTSHNRQAFESLCLLREGKYEMRGWERPAEWTEPIVLDPLRAIITAMAADELFDRRSDVLERLGNSPLRLADDFDDLASRLALTPEEHETFMRLHVPRSLEDFTSSIQHHDPEAFLAAVALVGLVDVADATSVAIGLRELPESEDVELDAASFLTPVEPTSSPPDALLRPLLVEEEVVVDDAYSLLTPVPESDAPSQPSTSLRAQWNDEMSTQLDAALGDDAAVAQRSAAEDAFGSIPLDDIGFAPPEIYTPVPAAPKTVFHGNGELELEPSAEEEPLELDLQRAPISFREQMLQQTAPKPPAAKPSDSRPSRPALKPVPPKPGVTTPSRPVSTLAPKPPPAPVEEYNPFAVHFRKAAALAPSSMEELEDRLDRALRGESMPRAGARPRAVPPPPATPPARPAVPTPPRAAPAVPSRATPPGGLSAILSDIEDTVGADPLPSAPGPITLESTTPASRTSDDELAILAAEEAARASAELDLDGTSTVFDDPIPDEPPPAPAEDEIVVEDDVRFEPTPGPGAAVGFEVLTPPEPDETSGPAIQLTPVPSSQPPISPPERTPTPVPTSTGPVPTTGPNSTDRAGDARRRLLQRAFKNVAGTVMNREPSARHNVRAPDSIAPRPENADTSLEQDLSTRLSELPRQDHFARLAVGRNASLDEIKEAFLNLAKRYHPDRLSAMGQNHLLPQARELFSRIKESYDVLVDPASRARYMSDLNNKDGANKVKLSPEEAKTAYHRGTIYLRKRDFKNAEAEFIRAIDGDPQAEYMAELAWTLLSNPATKDTAKQEVRELIARALKSGTENDRTFVVAAHVARAENEHEKAEKYFRRAIEKNPKNIEAARELRLIEMRRGGEKKSGSFFDKLRVKPANPK